MLSIVLTLSLFALGEVPDPSPIVPDPSPIVAPVVKQSLTTQPQHSHRCPRCGTTWSHGDESHGNAAAHRCPACGYGPVWGVHSRSLLPTIPSIVPQSVPYQPRLTRRVDCPT